MKYNLGASSETEYGLYYQWGAVRGYTGDEAKAHSYWSTCPFNGGASSYDSTYWAAHSGECVDSSGELLSVNDCVYQATNGRFKLPTKTQIDELVALTNEWIENYNGSGINGRLFHGNNGNTLFVPAAGGYYSGIFSGSGSYGGCWGSSLKSDNPSVASYLYMLNKRAYSRTYYRMHGFSARGVLC